MVYGEVKIFAYALLHPARSVCVAPSAFYAALLRRRGPHIALHSVYPSVPLRCQPCGRAVSFVLFTCQGRITYGDLSRTSLFLQFGEQCAR